MAEEPLSIKVKAEVDSGSSAQADFSKQLQQLATSSLQKKMPKINLEISKINYDKALNKFKIDFQHDLQKLTLNTKEVVVGLNTSQSDNNARLSQGEIFNKQLQYESILSNIKTRIESLNNTSVSHLISQLDDLYYSLNNINSTSINGFENKVKTLDNTLNGIEKSKISLATTKKKLSEITNVPDDVTQSFQQLKTLYSQIQNAPSFNSQTQAINAYNLQLKNTTSLLHDAEAAQKKKIKTDQRSDQQVASATRSYENLKSQLTKLGQNSKFMNSYGSQYSNLMTEFNAINKSAPGAAKNIESVRIKMKGLQTEAQKSGQWGSTLFNTLSSGAQKFASWLTVSQIVMQTINTLKQMFSTAVSINSAMTELKKTSNETSSSYNSFMDRAIDKSKELKSSVSDTVTSTSDFSRLGFNLADSEQLATAAITYKKVGDGIESISDASSSIISTMKAYNIEAKNSMEITDKFNEIGNNFAISSKGIGDALMRSASSLAAANNTLDESIGLAVAANATVQDPDVAGTGIRTLSMRLRNSAGQLEELGEDADGAAESVTKLQTQLLNLTKGKVNIFEDDNVTYKSSFKILDELQPVWNDLTDKDRADITRLIAGTRQGNILNSMMANWDDAKSAMEVASNSTGSAAKEMDTYYQSIQASLDGATASFQALSNTVIDSDALKSLIDLGSNIFDILESIAGFDIAGMNVGFSALLSTIIAIASSSSGLKFFTKIDSTESGLGNKLGIQGKSFNTIGHDLNNNQGIFNSLFKNEISKSDLSSIETFIKLRKDGVSVNTAWNQSMTECSKAGKQAAVEVAKGNTNFENLKNAQNAATASTIGLTLAETALNAAISMGAMLLVQGLFTGIDYLIHYQDKLVEKANDLTTEWDNQSKSLRENKQAISNISKEYESLSSGVDAHGKNISLSTEEYERYNSIVNQIAEMFPTMVQGYTNEGNAIIKHKGDVEALTRAYKAQEQAARDSIITGADDVFKAYNAVMNGTMFSTGKNFAESIAGQLKSELENQDYDAASNLLYQLNQSNPDILSKMDIDSKDASRKFGESQEEFDIRMQSLLEKVSSYYNQTISNINAETDKIKPIARAILGNDQDFNSLAPDIQDKISQLVDNANYGFYDEFNNGNLLRTALSNIVDSVTSDRTLQTALNEWFQLDPSSLSISEYDKALNTIVSQLSSQSGLEENQIKLLLNIDDSEINEQLNTLRQSFSNLLDISPSEFNLDSFGTFNVSTLQKIHQYITSISDDVEVQKNSFKQLYSSINSIRPEQLNKLISSLDFKYDSTSHVGISKFNSQLAETINTLYSVGNVSENAALSFYQAFSDAGENVKTTDDFLKDSVSDLKEYTTAIEDLSSAYNSISKGDSLDFSNILSLLEKSPELAGALNISDDGSVSIEKESILEMIQLKTQSFQLDLQIKESELEAEKSKLEGTLFCIESEMVSRNLLAENAVTVGNTILSSENSMFNSTVNWAIGTSNTLLSLGQNWLGLGSTVAEVNGMSNAGLLQQQQSLQAQLEKIKLQINGISKIRNINVPKMITSPKSSASDKAKDKAEENAKKAAEAQEKYNDKVDQTNEKLDDLDKKEHLQQLKNTIEEISLLLEGFDGKLDIIELQLELTDEKDFSTRMDIISDKISLLSDKGAALKNEFSRLSGITPQTAEEADTISSRMESIGEALRSNLKDWVSYTKELESIRIDSILENITGGNGIVETLNKELTYIDRNMRALKGESLFDDVDSFFGLMPPPTSTLDSQRSEHEQLISEQQQYEDEIQRIKSTALEMQQAANAQAIEEERQDLYDALADAKKDLAETLADIAKSTSDAAKDISTAFDGMDFSGFQNGLSDQLNNTAYYDKLSSDIKDKLYNVYSISTQDGWNKFCEEDPLRSMQLLISGDYGWEQLPLSIQEYLNSAFSNGQSYWESLRLQENGTLNAFLLNILSWNNLDEQSREKLKQLNINSRADWEAYISDDANKLRALQILVSSWDERGIEVTGYLRSIIEQTQGYADANHISIKYDFEPGQIDEKQRELFNQGNGPVSKQTARNELEKQYNIDKFINSRADGGLIDNNNPTLVNEENRVESAILPNGKFVLLGDGSPQIIDLPIGTKVIPADETSEILKLTKGRQIGNTIPHLAEGNTNVNIGTNSDPADYVRLKAEELKYITALSQYYNSLGSSTSRKSNSYNSDDTNFAEKTISQISEGLNRAENDISLAPIKEKFKSELLDDQYFEDLSQSTHNGFNKFAENIESYLLDAAQSDQVFWDKFQDDSSEALNSMLLKLSDWEALPNSIQSYLSDIGANKDNWDSWISNSENALAAYQLVSGNEINSWDILSPTIQNILANLGIDSKSTWDSIVANNPLQAFGLLMTSWDQLKQMVSSQLLAIQTSISQAIYTIQQSSVPAPNIDQNSWSNLKTLLINTTNQLCADVQSIFNAWDCRLNYSVGVSYSGTNSINSGGGGASRVEGGISSLLPDEKGSYKKSLEEQISAVSTPNRSGLIDLAMSQAMLDPSKYHLGGDNKVLYNGGAGEAWCHAFIGWLFQQCGLQGVFPTNTWSCEYGRKWFESQGRFFSKESGYIPKPGDVVYYGDQGQKDGKSHHVGLVTGVSNGKIDTIEGNTSNDEVKYRRSYHDIDSASLMGYAVPAYRIGTNSATGGVSLVGEEGRELMITPDGHTHIVGKSGGELINIAPGTKIIKHSETENILKYTGDIDGDQIPKFANGTGDGLGYISAKYEVGGYNPGYISSGAGDHGGKSYGIPQFPSAQGNLKNFINWLRGKDPEIYKYFEGLSISSSAFDKAWKTVANNYPDRFAQLQIERAYEEDVQPFINSVNKKYGIDLNRSRALQEFAFSTAIQFGNKPSVMGNVDSSMSDSEIIQTSYGYRRNNVNSLFKSSSQNIRNNLRNGRFVNEEKDLLSLVGQPSFGSENNQAQSTYSNTAEKITSDISSAVGTKIQKSLSELVNEKFKSSMEPDSDLIKLQADYQSKKVDKTNRIKDWQTQLVSSEEDLIHEQQKTKDWAHEKANEIRSLDKYKDLFSEYDIDSFYDNLGEFTSSYNEVFKAIQDENNPEKLESFKELTQAIQYPKQLYGIADQYISDIKARFNDPELAAEFSQGLVQAVMDLYDEDMTNGYRLQKQSLLKASNSMKEEYNSLLQQYYSALENGSSQEVIREIYDALSTVQDNMDTIDEKWNSVGDSMRNYFKELAAATERAFSVPIAKAEKALEHLELNYGRQERYATKNQTLTDQINGYLPIQELLKQGMDKFHAENESIRSSNEYQEVTKRFDTDSWFDLDNEFTNEYYDAIKLAYGDPELVDKIKLVASMLQSNKQNYMDYQGKFEDNENTLWNLYGDQWELNHERTLELAERTEITHNNILSILEKESDELSRQYDKATKYEDKLDLLTQKNLNLEQVIAENESKQDSAHSGANSLRNQEQYRWITDSFDVEAWYDINGDFTKKYYDDMEDMSKVSTKEQYRMFQTFGESLQVYKKQWYDAKDAIIDCQDSIYDNTQTKYELQVEMAQTALDKVLSMIENRKEKELEALETVHTKRKELLDQELESANKVYQHTLDALNDTKSEEDYQKQLSDEQESAQKLQARINALALDDSDAARLKRLELEKQLKEQQSKISELQRQHEYEQTVKAIQKDQELMQEHFDTVQDAEDSLYDHEKEQLELRYTEEAKYNEAIRALQTGTFREFSEKGIETYRQLYEEGNRTAISLTDAYTNFANETGEAFSNLGSDFENYLGLLSKSVEAYNAIINQGIKDWNDYQQLYSNGNSKPSNDSSDDNSPNKSPSNNSPSNIPTGGTYYSARATDSEKKKIDQMISNSKDWYTAEDDRLKEELHASNISIANSLGAYFDDDSGRWYKDGLPLYHTEKYSSSARKAIETLNNSLSDTEELAVIENKESVLQPTTLEEWAKSSEMLSKMVSGFSKTSSPPVNTDLVNNYRKMANGINYSINNINSNNKVDIKLGDIIINGEVDKETVKQIKDATYNGVVSAIRQFSSFHGDR